MEDYKSLVTGPPIFEGFEFYKKSLVRFLWFGTIGFFVLLLFGGLLVFAVLDGRLQSSVVQSVSPLFNASVLTLNEFSEGDVNVVNDYDFDDETYNGFNITNNFHFNIDCDVVTP